MNCFNIREVQSLLKRKFFVDLVNTHDYRHLLDKSMISIKYKTNDFTINNTNAQIFYNFGLDLSSKIRLDLYSYEKMLSKPVNKTEKDTSVKYSFSLKFIIFLEKYENFKLLNFYYINYYFSYYFNSLQDISIKYLFDCFLNTINLLVSICNSIDSYGSIKLIINNTIGPVFSVIVNILHAIRITPIRH
jgi:hypothetical protein